MVIQRVLICCLAIAPVYLAAMTGTRNQKDASVQQLMQMAQAQLHDTTPSLLAALPASATGN